VNRTRVLALLALAALAAAPAAVRAAGPIPTVVSVAPATGPTTGGTTVTITGTDFVDPMSATFGGAPASDVTVTSPTTLTCTTPPHAKGPVAVVVSQTTPPASTSAPFNNGFTYVDPPSYVWVPRAPGSATGGNPGGWDVDVVDMATRAVVGRLDLNAADPDLPTDNNWSVTQVLFDSSGATAYLATAGTPGGLDSQKVFLVRTARVVGTEAGNPILGVIDTDGNPYQLALAGAQPRLFVADAGSWAASAANLPNGTFRAYDVTDPAAPTPVGTPADIGILPALAYDLSSYQGWGTNSSFRGLVQSKGGRCVVTNAGSHTLTVVNTATLAVADTQDVGVAGGGAVQATTSIPSPFSDDFVFVQTTDLLSQATEYFVYRISTASLVKKGAVAVPMQFFPLLPRPDLANRLAWPHPDGESMVAVPAADASLATWSPASGSAANRTAIQGGGPPVSLGFNDASGFFYAREADGGWTVFTVGDQRGTAPAEVARIPEGTGVNSLRVVGDGTFLVGTTTSTLAVVDGKAGSPTVHTVVDPVALDLDPAGGPSFPQPGANGGAARTFVTAAGPGGGPALVLPLPGTEFCAGDAPPEFEIPADAGARVEIELGTQYDFLPVPGSIRMRFRVPDGETTASPALRQWKRILRRSAGGVTRPFYARIVVLSGGRRLPGPESSFRVCAPTPPVLAAPADLASIPSGTPPTFDFDPAQAGTAWIVLTAPSTDDRPYRFGRVKVRADGGGPLSVPLGTAEWNRVVERARKAAGGTLPAPATWTVEVRDVLRRRVSATAPRTFTITP
jgi:hypothetical protein